MEQVSRVQKIGSGGTAFSFIEEPAELPLLVSHGCLYAVIDLAGETVNNPHLISRLLWDTLRESYFNEISRTPMQALEKALADVSGRMLGLSLNPVETVATLPLEINISAVVKWGNYLYTALVGGGKVFIVRKGLGVSEIVSDPSLGVSLTSQTLEEGDIALIVSRDLGSNLSDENLLKHLGGLEQEVVGSTSKLALVIRNNTVITAPSSLNRSQQLLRKVKAKISAVTTRGSTTPEERRGRLLGITAVVLGTMLVGSLLVSFRDTKKTTTQTQVLGDATTTLTTILKEASDNLDINPSKTKESLLAAEQALTNLSPEERRSSKVKALQEQLNSLNLAVYKIQTLASFKEASMPATIYFAEKTIATTSLDKAKVVAEALYSTLLYALIPSESQIYKAVPQADGSFAITKWLTTTADLSSSVGLAVDGEVWVLTPQTILRFYKGVAKDFALSGLDKPFSNPQALYTDEDADNLYVYDAGNSRLVAFNKLGSYQFQILLPALPVGTRGFYVDEAKQTFTFVNGGQAVAGSWQ